MSVCVCVRACVCVCACVRALYVYMFSAVKLLIMINHIQNKSFCIHNICVCAVYIYYVYINTHTCMYIFKKKYVMFIHLKYLYIISII